MSGRLRGYVIARVDVDLVTTNDVEVYHDLAEVQAIVEKCNRDRRIVTVVELREVDQTASAT